MPQKMPNFAVVKPKQKDTMTRKEIESAMKNLPKLSEMTETQEREYRELRCREMINSIMIYGNINSPYNERTGEFDYYLREYVNGCEYYVGLGAERVLELIREQQEDFSKASVNHNVYTDCEGVTYNSCVWCDD